VESLAHNTLRKNAGANREEYGEYCELFHLQVLYLQITDFMKLFNPM
jgi:hypothetical protein